MSQDKLLFLLVTIISLIALISFGLSPFFQINEITFSGQGLLSTEELNNYLKSYYANNLIILDSSKIKTRLLQSPYIEEVQVIKKYPNGLEIVIKERRPLAKINNNGKYLVFTIDGYILEDITRVGGMVPEIKGMGYSLKGEKIIFAPELEQVLQALVLLDRETVARLSLIEMTEDGSIQVLAGNLPIFLGGSDELEEKFRILQSILVKGSKENLLFEYIDLSITQRPVVKLKSK